MNNLPFGGQVPLTYFQQLCQDVFENYSNSSVANLGHGKEQQPSPTLQQLHARALAINKLFGGVSNVSKRVIFTHGALDPWRAAGLQYGSNVLLIKGMNLKNIFHEQTCVFTYIPGRCLKVYTFNSNYFLCSY